MEIAIALALTFATFFIGIATIRLARLTTDPRVEAGMPVLALNAAGFVAVIACGYYSMLFFGLL